MQIMDSNRRLSLRENADDQDPFKLLVDCVEDYAIYMLDSTGHVTTWNRGAELAKGYTREEIIGRHYQTFFTSEDAAAGLPDQLLSDAATNGRSVGEGWRVRKTGERFWASYVLTVILADNGQVAGFAKITRDLTERKKQDDALRAMESQLREERDRLHGAAESSMDCLYICEAVRDREGKIEDFQFVYLNRNAEQMVSIPKEVLLGGKMCELLPVNQTLGLIDRYKEVVEKGEPFIYEFAVEDQSVKSSWIRVQAVKLRDGIAITASDISERKRNEQQVLYLAHHDSLTGLPNAPC
jgi:PAS domain S-box-containing protein